MAGVSRCTQLSEPVCRPLRVFAFDPSRGRLLGNEMQIDVRYRPVAVGPMEESGALDKVAVLDYDLSRKKYYRPVDLNDPSILIANGIPPSESDPRFHQQMVYAVASDTIEQFENVLGRRIHWHRAERALDAPKGWQPDDILTLMLYPHALHQANAFYSPQAHGILFGYFTATDDDPGRNIPGQLVFTCLSHDIIVHEMTHAILDGLRGHFMEQTNPDVAAFHEAFADIVALFRHFTHREVLEDAIQRTGGRLYSPALKGRPLADQAADAWLTSGEVERNPLLELAGQFGEATGMHKGLRSAIGKPKTMKQLQNALEPHERGSILVAAVFDAFFTIYIQRAAQYFRIYRSGGGRQNDDLPAPLADALCNEAMETAKRFFQTCVRALDYLPPVDITFGDFLRAVMTSEMDFDPADHEGIRDAWMQAFRRRQILPLDAHFFSQQALCWPAMKNDLHIDGLPFGGPLGLSYEERRQTAKALANFISQADNRILLGLDSKIDFAIPSFHPLYRRDSRGGVRWDLVVEVVQTRDAASRTDFPLRGGATLIISTHSTCGSSQQETAFLRYAISKPLIGSDAPRRIDEQRTYLMQQGIKPNINPNELRINFELLHGAD